MAEEALTATPQLEKDEDCEADVDGHETLLRASADEPVFDVPDIMDGPKGFLNKLRTIRRAIEDGHSLAYGMRNIGSVAKILHPEAYVTSKMDSKSRRAYMFWKGGSTPPAPDWNIIAKPCPVNAVEQKKYILWAKYLNKMYRQEGLNKDHAYGFAVHCTGYLLLVKAIQRVEEASIDAYGSQKGVDALEFAERKVLNVLFKLVRRKRQRVMKFVNEWNKESFRTEAALNARLASCELMIASNTSIHKPTHR